jgi:FixJ family two-component response regulator
MRAGAIDFLTKPVPKDVLLNAVASALVRAKRDGSDYFALEEKRQLFATLTSREREVMERVVVGRLNKQIASDLGTTEKTVKVHRARVMRKMHARTLADLVRLGEKLNLRYGQNSSHLEQRIATRRSTTE